MRGEAAVQWWFQHIERMEGDRLVKKILSRCGGKLGPWGRGRPKSRWMSGCLKVRANLTIQEAIECVKDGREWRS